MRRYGDTSPHLERHVDTTHRHAVVPPRKLAPPDPVGAPIEAKFWTEQGSAPIVLPPDPDPDVYVPSRLSGMTRSVYPVEVTKFGDRERTFVDAYDGYGYTLPAPPDPARGDRR